MNDHFSIPSHRSLPLRFFLLLLLSTGAASEGLSQKRACTLTTIGVAPLNDLGFQEYKPGFTGALYPGGRNTRPEAHEVAGQEIATHYLLPRDAMGQVDLETGRIGMISIGMSNTRQEFDNGEWTFKPRAELDPATNPKLVLINGAQGGQTAMLWSRPDAPAWAVLDERIAEAGLERLQIQAAWIKQAEKFPAELGEFPVHAEVLRDHLEAIVQIARSKYPNLRIAYLSSRTRAYTDDPTKLNPEPFAYESGFSVRWLIEKQLSGDSSLAFDPQTGVAPWLSWGPYLWADGEVERSDGFVWLCTDVESDRIHPSTSGETKVADQLLAFFKTDPTATPWFLRNTMVGQPPEVEVASDVDEGEVPLTVRFVAQASDSDGTVSEFAWTFEDGCFSFEQNPTKLFAVPDSYIVRLTVSDDDGNTVQKLIPIIANESGDPLPPVITEPLSLSDGIVGAAYTASFTATGTSPITWSVSAGVLPPGIILSSDGVYSGTPLEQGSYSFTIEASNSGGLDFRDYTHTIAQSSGSVHLFVPVADAYVEDGSRSSANFGSLDSLLVRTTGTVGRNARSYLKFDLGSLDCAPQSAQLQLFLNSLSRGNSAPVQVFSVEDDAWQENTITWENKPAESLELDSAVLEVVGTWYQFDVNSFISQELDGDRIASFCILDHVISSVLAGFDSREGANSPALEITCQE